MLISHGLFIAYQRLQNQQIIIKWGQNSKYHFSRDKAYMDVRHNKRLLAHVWIVCALGLFIDGYDLYISSVAEPFINALYHPTPFMIGLIQAAAPIGAALGALLIGRVADKIGRKSLLILNLLFFVLIALLSACAWDIVSLCVFRFLIGFGRGAS